MRVLFRSFILAALFVVAACDDAVLVSAVASTHVQYDITIQSNPILREIESQTNGWNDEVNIAVENAPPGSSREDVIAAMAQFDFDLIPSDSEYRQSTHYFQTPLRPSDVAFRGPLLSDGVCGIDFLASAQFDEDDRLVRIVGWKVMGGCL
ncbi:MULTISPECIES: hypothetical protein [Hyphobacterium]|uniref:DUF4864 domain-containing protein n=1 Tax=Hyphobacterium vulgare TaxID=1736751 RepID=A0ABV6ZX75_9PROT